MHKEEIFSLLRLIEKTKIIIDNNTDANQGNKENDKTNSVFRMQSEKQTKINIEEDKNLFSKKKKYARFLSTGRCRCWENYDFKFFL